MKSVAYETLLI